MLAVVALLVAPVVASAAECAGKKTQGVSVTPDPVTIRGALDDPGLLTGVARITLPGGTLPICGPRISTVRAQSRGPVSASATRFRRRTQSSQ